MSATKGHSSFAHFFKTRVEIPRELSEESHLVRHMSGRVSELELGLNADMFAS